MEQAARRSHEITLIGDIQGRKQTHICHRGGNSRGKARSLIPTTSMTSLQLALSFNCRAQSKVQCEGRLSEMYNGG